MEIIHNPISEIYISQVVKSTIQDLTKLQAIKSQTLSYCNNCLYVIDLVENDDLKKSIIDCKLYIDSIQYAPCPSFIEVSKYNGYAVDVINRSNFDVDKAIIDYVLKK